MFADVTMVIQTAFNWGQKTISANHQDMSSSEGLRLPSLKAFHT